MFTFSQTVFLFIKSGENKFIVEKPVEHTLTNWVKLTSPWTKTLIYALNVMPWEGHSITHIIVFLPKCIICIWLWEKNRQTQINGLFSNLLVSQKRQRKAGEPFYIKRVQRDRKSKYVAWFRIGLSTQR